MADELGSVMRQSVQNSGVKIYRENQNLQNSEVDSLREPIFPIVNPETVDSLRKPLFPIVNPETVDSLRKPLFPIGNPERLGVGDKITLGSSKKPEPTEENLKAKAELDSKVSSTGISYKDAENTIQQLREKYKDNPNYQSLVESKQPEGLYIYIHSHKAFDPYKLPEPDRTAYIEANEAMKEIKNNNSALYNQAGSAVSDLTAGDAKDGFRLKVEENIPDKLRKLLDSYIAKNAGKKGEPTEADKLAQEKKDKAKEQLNSKVSSSGMDYKTAKNTIDEIRNKYKDNPDYQSEFESKQPEGLHIYILPHKAFDPYKLPEPDKTKYFEAIESAREIERTNSALLSQSGLGSTSYPESPWSGRKQILQ